MPLVSSRRAQPHPRMHFLLGMQASPHCTVRPAVGQQSNMPQPHCGVLLHSLLRYWQIIETFVGKLLLPGPATT